LEWGEVLVTMQLSNTEDGSIHGYGYIHGYPRKIMDMDTDMYAKFHIHGKPKTVWVTYRFYYFHCLSKNMGQNSCVIIKISIISKAFNIYAN